MLKFNSEFCPYGCLRVCPKKSHVCECGGEVYVATSNGQAAFLTKDERDLLMSAGAKEAGAN